MSIAAQEPAVLCERRGAVLVITLNRPEAMNAIDGALAQGLVDAVTALDGDPEVGAGVITGSGRGFCAGMDLKAFANEGAPSNLLAFYSRGASKPLVAAVEGFALAGGLEVALTCDLIVAAKGAKLGLPEAKVGLLAAGGALFRLPRRVPFGFAMELALSGRSVTAEDAAARGLVDRVTDVGEALVRAIELATEIASNAPMSLSAAKSLLWSTGATTDEDGWAQQRALADRVFASDDAIEGARAFAAKRDPVWTGH